MCGARNGLKLRFYYVIYVPEMALNYGKLVKKHGCKLRTMQRKNVGINKNCETFIDYDSASHKH